MENFFFFLYSVNVFKCILHFFTADGKSEIIFYFICFSIKKNQKLFTLYPSYGVYDNQRSQKYNMTGRGKNNF